MDHVTIIQDHADHPMIGHLLRLWRRPPVENAVPSPNGQRATVDDIRACFRLLLGREPNPEEWPGHSSHAGQDLKEVVSSFLRSYEFSRRKMIAPAQFALHVVVDVNGVKVAVYPDDIDVGALVVRNAYEPHVTALFERRIKFGMRVLDVGANCGYFTFLARRLVGDRGMVFAVEPNISNVRLLEIGRRENAFSDVHVVPVAAGSSVGTATLHAGHTNGMTNALTDSDDIMETNLVCQMPLDAIVDNVDFLKIDVEGQELDALRGFTSGLERRPMIVSEFSPTMIRDAMGEEYLRFLFARGYEIGVIGADGTVASYHREPSAIMKAFSESRFDHIDIFAAPA